MYRNIGLAIYIASLLSMTNSNPVNNTNLYTDFKVNYLDPNIDFKVDHLDPNIGTNTTTFFLPRTSVPLPSTYLDVMSDTLPTVLGNQNGKEEFLENLKNGIIKAEANLWNSKREEILREFIDYPLPKMQSKEFYKEKLEELRSYDEKEIKILVNLIAYCSPDEKFKERVVIDLLDAIGGIVKQRKEIFTLLNDCIDESKTKEEFSWIVEQIFNSGVLVNDYFKEVVILYEKLSKLSDDERILQGIQEQQSKQLEVDGRKQSKQGKQSQSKQGKQSQSKQGKQSQSKQGKQSQKEKQLIHRMQQVKKIKLQEGTLENSEKLTDETLKKLKTFKKYFEHRMNVLRQLIHFDDLSDKFKEFFLEKLEEHYKQDNDILKAIIPDTERYQQVMKIRRECINAFKTQESYNDLCEKCKEFEEWYSNEMMNMIQNLLPDEKK